MKIRNILIGIFTLLTFATHAQNEKNQKVETKTAVTELKVETENLDELKNFDWNIVKENDSEQKITLAFAYVNKSEIGKPKARFDNFEMKLTGKTADLDKLTARLKKSFDKLDDIVGRNIKN